MEVPAVLEEALLVCGSTGRRWLHEIDLHVDAREMLVRRNGGDPRAIERRRHLQLDARDVVPLPYRNTELTRPVGPWRQRVELQALDRGEEEARLLVRHAQLDTWGVQMPLTARRIVRGDRNPDVRRQAHRDAVRQIDGAGARLVQVEQRRLHARLAERVHLRVLHPDLGVVQDGPVSRHQLDAAEKRAVRQLRIDHEAGEDVGCALDRDRHRRDVVRLAGELTGPARRRLRRRRIPGLPEGRAGPIPGGKRVELDVGEPRIVTPGQSHLALRSIERAPWRHASGRRLLANRGQQPPHVVVRLQREGGQTTGRMALRTVPLEKGRHVAVVRHRLDDGHLGRRGRSGLRTGRENNERRHPGSGHVARVASLLPLFSASGEPRQCGTSAGVMAPGQRFSRGRSACAAATAT